jgi:hypothetical protein
MKQKQNRQAKEWMLVAVLAVAILLSGMLVFAAEPTGTAPIVEDWNSTKNVTAAQMVNISGGYISAFNLTAETQNSRWKAFVGNVFGSFTLQDASGNEIYDWSIATIAGNVFATRYSGASDIEWSSIGCATSTQVNSEDAYLSHTGGDNISSTFIEGGTHQPFNVGGTAIGSNSCFTLNTYNSTGSQDSSFEEIILADGDDDIVFATNIEDDATGFDGNAYDFQMIVPENGSASWSSATPYYMYVELLSS